MHPEQLFPFLSWLKDYNATQLKGDLIAGLTIGVVLIPQGMAYAMLGGMPPIYGLYAGLVPLLVYTLFGTSRYLAVGPVAMDSLLVAAGVGLLAEMGSEHFISLAITLALLVGGLQILLGVFRLGFLVNFLSQPVVSGFTSAAAIIIGLSQLKYLLGIDIARSNRLHEILFSTFQQLDHINWLTFCIGILGIAMIKLLKKIHHFVPAALLTVIAASLCVYYTNLPQYGVQILGAVPSGLPHFQLPNLDFDTFNNLWSAALTLAFIGFMESVAIGKALQGKKRDHEIDPNKEFIALGLANLGGAFFQAYPVAGSFSRSAINDSVGGKTPMTGLIAASLLGLTLLYFTHLFFYLPHAVLASIIMASVFGLIDIKEAHFLWQSNKYDLTMMVITFLVTLFVGIKEGILVGVLLSLGVMIYRSSTPNVAVLGRLPDTRYYRNKERFDEVKIREDIMIVRFDAQLYFANVAYFKDSLQILIKEKGSQLKLLIISGSSINRIDSSGMHAIQEVLQIYQQQGIRVCFTKLIGPVRDSLYKSGLIEKIGKENIFLHIQDAVDFFDESVQNQPLAQKNKERALQTDVE
ncbi:MAG: SulP family inorganic anion transporter [Chitinophagales bacterium]